MPKGKRKASESSGGGAQVAIAREEGMSTAEAERYIALYMSTIIAPETTSAVPLLYATGPSTQKLVPEATFEKLPTDWPQIQTGSLYANQNRMFNAADNVITDQIGQPLQLLNILGDEATQAGMFEQKNSLGADCPYRWTAPGGGQNFICSAVQGLSGGTTNPQLFEDIMPINANYDPTVVSVDLFNSTYYNGTPAPLKSLSTISFHGPVLPVLKANGHNYIHIDGCNQVRSLNGTSGSPFAPQAGFTAAANILTAQGSTSSCILISEGSYDPQLVKVFPTLTKFVTGDKITVVLNQFKNNTDGNPIYEVTFTIPATWPPTGTSSLIGVLPIPASDEWRLRVSITTVAAVGTNVASCRSLQIGHTSCGGILAHKMAPGMDGGSVLSLATMSRLWGNGLNVKNWTVLGGRGAIAVVYKMQKGDYYSEAFGMDAGDPYKEMASQPDEIDDTFEKGERFFNTPPCEEEDNRLRENIDQPTKKQTSKIPDNFTATYPWAISYEGVDRNLTAQCLKSNGLQNIAPSTAGGTNVFVNQQPAQNLDATWWTRWEFVANSKDSQVFYKHLPPKSRGLFEAAAGRTALMKKSGPSTATLDYFYQSEGYLARKQASMGSNIMMTGLRRY